MSNEAIPEELLRILNDRLDDLKGDMARGCCADYAHYRFIVGACKTTTDIIADVKDLIKRRTFSDDE